MQLYCHHINKCLHDAPPPLHFVLIGPLFTQLHIPLPLPSPSPPPLMSPVRPPTIHYTQHDIQYTNVNRSALLHV